MDAMHLRIFLLGTIVANLGSIRSVTVAAGAMTLASVVLRRRF
jgi:hypothetical protein